MIFSGFLVRKWWWQWPPLFRAPSSSSSPSTFLLHWMPLWRTSPAWDSAILPFLAFISPFSTAMTSIEVTSPSRSSLRSKHITSIRPWFSTFSVSLPPIWLFISLIMLKYDSLSLSLRFVARSALHCPCPPSLHLPGRRDSGRYQEHLRVQRRKTRWEIQIWLDFLFRSFKHNNRSK